MFAGLSEDTHNVRLPKINMRIVETPRGRLRSKSLGAMSSVQTTAGHEGGGASEP